MKNRSGWLRIVEAFFAVMLVLAVLLVMVTRSPKKEQTERVQEIQRFILEQISSNDVLRQDVLDEDNNSITTFIEDQSLLPSRYDFTIRICNISMACGMPIPVERDVYADEILVTSTLEEYGPKKLKLFVWKKT